MRICVINTGGTISCVGQPLAPMPAGDFARAAQDLLMPALKARLPALDLHFATGLRFASGSGTLDSTDLQPADWCRMAGHVLDHYADFDGFLILHGTDTLDFTGAALPMLLNVAATDGRARALLSKPVILTASQLPLFREGPRGLVLNAGSDAFVNLAGALACMALRLPEVTAFFDGQLFRASRILKTSTTSFGAFSSPHLPPLARLGTAITLHAPALPPPPAHLSLAGPAALALARDQLRAVAGTIDAHPVAQMDAFPARALPSGDAFLAQMIRATVGIGAKGLVLQSYGEGNFPSGAPGDPARGAIRQALAEAEAAGVVIVAASRVLQGSVGAFHYAAGAWLAEIGAVSARDMTPMAAFAKTIVLLSAAAHHGWDRDRVKALIGRDLWGEGGAGGADSGDATG